MFIIAGEDRNEAALDILCAGHVFFTWFFGLDLAVVSITNRRPVGVWVVTTEGVVLIDEGESLLARMSGNHWAAWRSVRFGGMAAATSRRTARPTGCTEKLSSSSTAGRTPIWIGLDNLVKNSRLS